MEILEGHIGISSNDYDLDKMINEKKVSLNHVNPDDLLTRIMLPTLAPKQNDIKIIF